MENKKYYIIDFDSTFTKVEALDELCDIVHAGKESLGPVLSKVKDITDRAMEGELSFAEGLAERIAIIGAHRDHLPTLVDRLKTKVTDSIARNKDFFAKNADDILIISNGFVAFIEPIVTQYGIKSENIYANHFEFDTEGNIIGFDKSNPLAGNNGKVKLMKDLNLKGDIYVIGDGYNDYEIKKAGIADKFFAFTENINREKVSQVADYIAPSFDEVLYVNKMPMAISYPKNRINVLLLENVHPNAQKMFEDEGYNVEVMKGALDENELAERIKGVSILGIRSKTNVTAKVLANANRLMAVGAFCIGTNQIDLAGCLEKGITVFNAPFSNTRSVVELAIGEIIMLMRNLPDKMAAMHQGKWDKSASGSFEIRGKKLGIVGYGNIGAQLSVLAENMGMKVYYYDMVEKLALGNATKCNSMEELLGIADVVSLHVDGRAENKMVFGEEQFAMMKKGSILVNLARGFVVDIKALTDNLKSGKLVGAGIDVFPEEPKNNQEPFVSDLLGMKNVILTPHIGGSTLEAQENIASFVPSKIIEYVNTGNTFNSVNFPNLQLPAFEKSHRLLHIHKNVSGILAKINSVLAKHEINIMGQYLKTNEQVGYVITDIDKEYDKQVMKDLKAIEDTIKFRILY
ncbi:phosphoglycerate dehydrogenase [Flammeovirgaceae bacterium SG7u.111]|nr:phosphoglycerate dehydrogenase [Flammeovirgaceae bacterium SG7u.132]WPO37052.1 phosphoglycerate dehydrogenase [Flammeovirgaceae bacterium SG7u.111]